MTHAHGTHISLYAILTHTHIASEQTVTHTHTLLYGIFVVATNVRVVRSPPRAINAIRAPVVVVVAYGNIGNLFPPLLVLYPTFTHTCIYNNIVFAVFFIPFFANIMSCAEATVIVAAAAAAYR